MPHAAELRAVSDAQLELLFDATGKSRENGAESAPQGQSGPTPPPGAAGRAEPVCYRGDCRWYQGAGGAHPEATAKPQRRRRAKQ